jgi:predicted nucleic acid-binding protein
VAVSYRGAAWRRGGSGHLGAVVGGSHPARAATSVNDMWIAACYPGHGVPLATLNIKDYEDFEQHHGLRILGAE